MPLWNVNQLVYSRLINTWNADAGRVMSFFSDMSFKIEPSLSFKGNYCNCVQGPGKKQHQFNPKRPMVLIIGDDFIPPTIGAMGETCPLVLRYPGGGDFNGLAKIIETIFEKNANGNAQTILSQGSVIFLSINTLLMRCSTSTFLQKYIELTNQIGKVLEKYLQKPRVIPFVLPISNGHRNSNLHLRISELLEILNVVRCELEISEIEIFSAGHSWFLDKPSHLCWMPQIGGGFTSREFYVPPCKYLGLEKEIFIKGGEKINFIDTVSASNICEFHQAASIESRVFAMFGDNLRNLGFDFPSEEEIALGYVMGKRTAENPTYFKNFLANPTQKAYNIVIVGRSIANQLAAELKNNLGFTNVSVVQLNEPKISSQVLGIAAAEINKLPSDPNRTIIFCGLGNSLLKGREERPVSVSKEKNGKIHIKGQVDTISDSDFDKLICELVLFSKAVSEMEGKLIILPPLCRHFTKCCGLGDHFFVDFDPIAFNKNIRDWGIYMCRSLRFKEIGGKVQVNVPFLGNIFGEDYTTPRIIGHDGVHLNQAGNRTLATAIGACVTSNSVTHNIPSVIPAGISVSSWRQNVRVFNPDIKPDVLSGEATLNFRGDGNSRRGRGRGGRGFRGKRLTR